MGGLTRPWARRGLASKRATLVGPDARPWARRCTEQFAGLLDGWLVRRARGRAGVCVRCRAAFSGVVVCAVVLDCHTHFLESNISSILAEIAGFRDH